MQPDWVFGGQSSTYPDNPVRWRSPDFGFHAESGSIFSYATGLPRVLPHRDEFEQSFRIYRCPSAGPLGEAIRVNFSMNEELDPTSGLAQTMPDGVKMANVVNPIQKILLINEDPVTMRNASYKPDGTVLNGRFILHEGRVTVAFIDGHLEAGRRCVIPTTGMEVLVANALRHFPPGVEVIGCILHEKKGRLTGRVESARMA